MIKENDRVLLKCGKHEYFVAACEKDLSTDKGIVKLAELIGMKSGDVIASHLGKEFRVVEPRPVDYFSHVKRTGAPMLPKDIGMVIAYTGMNHNDTVLDAGCGSGVAAIFFGGAAGHVVSYEKRPEFAEVCRKNIEEAGLTNVEVRAGDMLDAEGEGEYDIVHLDMQIEAEHVVHAHKLLKVGGYLVTYTPFLEHTFTVMDAAKPVFSEVIVHELIERELTRTERGTRPSTKVCHTGYITVCRK